MDFGRKDSFDRIMDEDTVFDRLWDGIDCDEDEDSPPPSPPPTPSLFRTRGQITTIYRNDDMIPNSEGSHTSTRRPWRTDTSNDAGYEGEDESPPRRLHTHAHEESPTITNHENKCEGKSRKKHPNMVRRKPRYPLNGTTPSERILASMLCCADWTLDRFERTCGIEEEMQTINEDVDWCTSLF